LTFIEYNIKNIHREINIISIILYSNTFLISLLIGTEYINIKPFYFLYIIKILIVSTISIVNYILSIWVRMYSEKNKNSYDYDIKISKHKKANTTSLSLAHSSINSKRTSVLSKILNYHYYENSGVISDNKFDDTPNINTSTTPEVRLYTSIIPSCQLTDISNDVIN